MRIIKQTDKILSVSHSDADGLACQVVLGNIFKNIDYIIQPFVKIDNVLATADFSQYDHVFITDIYPSVHQIMNRSDKFILIDHHDTALPLHDPKKMRFVDQSQCGAALVKKFVEAYFKIPLPHLDRFIYLINDYDLWLHKDPFSKDFNLLYDMYRGINKDMSAYRSRFMGGNVLLSDEEVDYIDGKHKEYTATYNGIEMIEFNHINGALVINVKSFVNEICHDLMVNNGYKIVFLVNAGTGHTNVRHCAQSLNIGELLTKLDLGGGHKFAAGMRKIEPAELFTKKLLTLEKFLYMNFPEMRRVEEPKS